MSVSNLDLKICAESKLCSLVPKMTSELEMSDVAYRDMRVPEDLDLKICAESKLCFIGCGQTGRRSTGNHGLRVRHS